MTSIIHRLLTRRANLADTMIDSVAGAWDLAEGELVLKVDRFALTTNNITYAAFAMRSATGWYFRPGARIGGRCRPGASPTWPDRASQACRRARGCGAICRSRTSYGCRRRMSPGAALVDTVPHRAAVPQVYSRYARCDADPHDRPEPEACQALFRPLFITSYTAADHLREQIFFGARRLVISSASSKTAYVLASRLGEGAPPLIALTSPANRAFVERLCCYDEVIEYDAGNALARHADAICRLFGQPVVAQANSSSIRREARARLPGRLDAERHLSERPRSARARPALLLRRRAPRPASGGGHAARFPRTLRARPSRFLPTRERSERALDRAFAP